MKPLKSFESWKDEEYNKFQQGRADQISTLKNRIAKLEKVLRLIADKYYCQCESADPEDGEGPYLCTKCRARQVLEGE